jgi:hypothetical protein
MALPIKTDLFSRTLPISLQLHSYGSPTMLCPAPFFPGYDRCVTAIHSQHATNYAVSGFMVCGVPLVIERLFHRFAFLAGGSPGGFAY